MYIKIGAVSFNTRTRRVNLDRRTIRNSPAWKHAAYAVGSVAATAGVAYISRRFA